MVDSNLNWGRKRTGFSERREFGNLFSLAREHIRILEQIHKCEIVRTHCGKEASWQQQTESNAQAYVYLWRC